MRFTPQESAVKQRQFKGGKLMKNKHLRILAALVMVAMLVFGTGVSATAQSLNATDIVSANNNAALGVIGAPVTNFREGSFNNYYWISRMSGDGAVCWIELDYATTARRLDSTLTIARSEGYFIHYDYYTLENTSMNSNNVYSRWDDGINYVARSASGTVSIALTQVASMSVSGWW